MPRYALGVQYIGADYAGWQAQPNQPSLQAELEAVLARVAGVDAVSTICAGRTDSGVNALGQVVHMDVPVARDADSWVRGCNRYLPADIKIVWAKEVSDDFHARYSAVQRHYRYCLLNHKVIQPLYAQRASWYAFPLDLESMQQATQYWVGEHDFSSFRAANCQAKTAVRHVTRFELQRHGDFIVADISANAFLYHMIRNFMGALLKIGAGKYPASWAQSLLAAKSRHQGYATAPAAGLYLVGVDYPEEFELPHAPTFSGLF